MSRQKKKTVKGQKKKVQKKKNKKEEKKWGLEFNVFNRGIKQYLDIDYVNKLSPEEKEFLNNFVQTYYNNVFPKKSKKGPKTNMFDKAGIARKEIFDQTNARNRDIYTTNYHVHDYQKKEGNEHLDSIFDLDRESYEHELLDYITFKRLVEDYMKAGLDEEEARNKALEDLEL